MKRILFIAMGVMMVSTAFSQVYNVRSSSRKLGNTTHTSVSVTQMKTGIAKGSRLFIGAGNGLDASVTWNAGSSKFSVGVEMAMGFKPDAPLNIGVLTLVDTWKGGYIGAGAGIGIVIGGSEEVGEYDGGNTLEYVDTPTTFRPYASIRVGQKIHRNLDIYSSITSNGIFAVGIAIIMRKK